MKKIFLSLLLSAGFLLNGCASTPVNDEELTELSLPDRRPREVILADKQLEAEIKEELADEYDDFLGQCHVNINVYNSAVLVTGETSNEEIRNKIIETIRIIQGVKRVHDNLVIAYPSDLDSRSNDALIKERLQTALGQIRSLPDFDSAMVKVVVENATVYLMGMVHREEGAVVINVIRHQPDVKQITTVFEYLD
ncbi:MAG: BON domain-containing protein [Methylobacter sp.]